MICANCGFRVPVARMTKLRDPGVTGRDRSTPTSSTLNDCATRSLSCGLQRLVRGDRIKRIETVEKNDLGSIYDSVFVG